MKWLINIVGIGFVVWVVMFVYIKYLEKKSVFYPDNEVLNSPEDIGLKYENVYFYTADNIKLHGWFIPSENNNFTILYCHGNAGNISWRLDIVRILHQAGWSVFIFDWRGYGKSEGSPSETGLYKDTEAAYNYLVNIKKIPPFKIILYGRSLGSVPAIKLASQLKEGYLIIEGGFSCGVDVAKTILPFLPKFLLKMLMGVKFEASNYIKKTSIPKLIIHSKDDEVIPFRLGKILFEQALPPKEFYCTSGTHNSAIFSNSQQHILKIKKFIDKYSIKIY